MTAAALTGPAPPDRVARPQPLYSLGAGLTADGTLVEVPVPATGRPAGSFLPGSRVLATEPAGERAAAERRAADQRAWLASGCLPGAGTRWAGSARAALLDLHTLTLPGGALVAAATPSWRYVWPRDASAGAVALAVAGHPGDAAEVLDFLSDRQQADGLLAARYLPDRPGVPDLRSHQLDGTGWLLWGMAGVAGSLDDRQRARFVSARRDTLDRSVAALRALTADGEQLPPPSPDYRELPEREVSLGVVAPLLAGLAAGAELYAGLGAGPEAAATRAAQDRFAATVTRAFGRAGYQRYPHHGGADSAVAMLLPPFRRPGAAGTDLAADRSLARAVAVAPARLARPGGGLSPGESWWESTLSWTPPTALFALTAAAAGDRPAASARLDWLDRHRTPLGALSEKVGPDGGPASVAPLAWTSALVLLTLHELDRLDRPAGAGRGSGPAGR